ncbi:type II toxin-antitoxin system PrlF family antitoxin [Pseudomonas sp. Sample_10]|jgi:antitoxin PrlF|uniref:type II toxin-antitoxin system PrlF family antitoxin n=1 Tax=Pseudomonas sp. Sample_10 TaxID=2448269 RepID=UPI0010367CAE|nr:type II toxin-antitoxin system PrlF family antitoxin [Pseudomonas sp. Sample_10]
MNDPLIPIITSANSIQIKTASARIYPMDAHLSASRTLELLAADMTAHPELIQPVDTRLVDRIIALVGQVDVDLNLPLSTEDE